MVVVEEQVDAHLLLAAHVHGMTYDSRCDLANVRAAYSRALTDLTHSRVTTSFSSTKLKLKLKLSHQKKKT